MGVSLECGELFPTLQRRVIQAIGEASRSRIDPIREQVLVIVPTRALRESLLRALADDKSTNLYGLNLMSINHLSIKVILDTLDSPNSFVSDSIFFPFALYNVATKYHLEPFESFRVCQALYQSIRDLIDGGVNADLFRDALEEAKRDPDIAIKLDFQELSALQRIYSRFETFLEENQIINLQTAAALASTRITQWVQSKRISRVIVYGFYDATQTQYDILEQLTRELTETNGTAQIFFPFPVNDTTVEYPAGYAQPFFDRMFSLVSRLGGQFHFHETRTPLASANLESTLFTGTNFEDKESARIEFLSAAGPYDEAWSVAKRILHLVKNHAVSFDQILVMTRTLDDPLPLMRVFEENRIPSNLIRGSTLAQIPYARFASLVVRARQARFNAATLFEFLSSPFVRPTGFRDMRNISDLMERLFIRNWDDWDRLKPLLQNDALPPLLEEEVKGNEQKRQSWKTTANSLLSLRKLVTRIPETSSLPGFARILIQVLQSLSGPFQETNSDSELKTAIRKKPVDKSKQLSLSFGVDAREANEQKFEEIAVPEATPQSTSVQAVMNLLRKLGGFSLFGSQEITLAEFEHLLELYMKQTAAQAAEQTQGVIVGDVMQLRGMTADYVFIMHLNREIFPRRLNEDPFLPDNARQLLGDLTGANVPTKRVQFSRHARLFPLKDGGEEELLLFAQVLRAAREKLFLSYQRSDAQGRKLTCSAYYDECLRLITGETSEENDSVSTIPRQMEAKILQSNKSGFLPSTRPEILPTLAECSALADWFPAEEVLQQTHKLPPDFSQQAMHFARRMNSYDMNEAAGLDGCIDDQSLLWSSVLKSRGTDHLRLSYSTLKSFFICPFKFFGSEVLRLEESPKETENDEQDLDPRTKGILAETVVKESIKHIKESSSSVEKAVEKATEETRQKYRDVFPPLILNFNMKKFQHAAENLLKYLQSEGFDLKLSVVPGNDNKETVELINNCDNEYGFPMIISGVLDLITFKSGKKNGLISDLKWGGSRTADTPNGLLDKGELQFCLYPAMYEVSSGEFLPFRYFRLNIFGEFGDPNQIEQKLRALGLKDSDRVMRFFGGSSIAAKTYTQETQYLRTKDCGIELLKAQFRILKDPGVPFSDCKYCSFTQLCRRSHAATLLRTRMADIRDNR